MSYASDGTRYDESYRGPDTIESFTEADLDRALARFGEPEDREFTAQHISHDGFWRPHWALRDKIDAIRARIPKMPPKSSMTWHDIINDPKYIE